MHFLLMENIYDLLTSRNIPIINSDIQRTISTTKILIAGCGLGSLISESLARMGFQHFLLVDNDIIELHNLNRQAYHYKHLGKSKVSSLKEVILDINPKANVTCYSEFISESNVDFLVSNSDIVIDTIDFLDLKSVILLHDKANEYKRPVFSTFAAAWGAVGVFLPPQDSFAYLRSIFAVSEKDLNSLSYTEKFSAFFIRLAPFLNSEVQEIMKNVFKGMQDNKPCPASVVITGAQCAAILCEKLLFDYLCGKINSKPDFYYIDLTKIIESAKIDIKL